MSLSLWAFRFRFRFTAIPYYPFALLIFALFPLSLFHYRQFLAFSILSLSLSYFTFKRISFSACLVFFILIFLAHPVYALPYLLFCFSRFKKLHLGRVTFTLPLAYSKLFIPLFIILFPLLSILIFYSAGSTIPLAFSIMPSVYSRYGTWFVANPSINLLALIPKHLIILPFILPFLFVKSNSLLNNEAKQAELINSINVNYKKIMYAAFCLYSAIVLIDYYYGFYAFARIASSLYPLMIYMLPFSIAKPAAKGILRTLIPAYGLLLSFSLYFKVYAMLG